MLIQADAYRIPLPDRSVHCCVTSPPYWGLRRYSGEQGRGEFPELGLEETPEEHIERMVQIFREVRRVLRDDGVVWLNYGDCYAGGGRGPGGAEKQQTNVGSMTSAPSYKQIEGGNLMLMPHRVAIALQDDGWIVRNDLIWYKRNPMPESVAGWRWERARKEKSRIKNGGVQMSNLSSMDAGISGGKDKVEWEYGDDYVLRQGSWRHTRAHEYIFQLVKKMGYYCNQEAVRVAHDPKYLKSAAKSRANRTRVDAKGGTSKDFRIDGAFDKIGGFNEMLAKKGVRPSPDGRNPRSVLDVPTAPYKGAHYATFPPNLIAPLIRASCPRRSCPECGQAWAPVVERGKPIPKEIASDNTFTFGAETSVATGGKNMLVGGNVTKWLKEHPNKIAGYRPTCEHNHDPIPGIVLDPFLGSGTTGQVARELQRRWIGLDISMDYIDNQAKPRALNLTPSNALDGLPLFDYEP